MSGEIVGRDLECAAIRAFLDDAAAEPHALFLDGDPGIGKTALWRDGLVVARESGYRVLQCTPDASEAAVSYAGLLDLIDPVADDIAALPTQQRSVIEVALLRRDGRAPSHLDVGFAVLSLLRLEHQEPTLIAIDDAQWLDEPSAVVLNYALRRLQEGRVRVLVSRRPGAEGPLNLSNSIALDRIEIGPMDLDNIGKLIVDKTASYLPRPVLVRVVEASGGNPFFALEIARHASDYADLDRLPIPSTLGAALRNRLDRLSDEGLEVSLITAALSRPTIAAVARAVGDTARCDAGLAEAETQDVLQIDGTRIALVHPLLGSTLYASVTKTKVRILHRKLAAVVDDVEERARHLALAAEGPDADTAALLEDAATVALTRGATASAAQLLERAAALTPTHQDQDHVRRLRGAAVQHYDSGDAQRARKLAQEAASVASSRADRASVLALLASIQEATDGIGPAMTTYSDALAEAEGLPLQQAAILEQMAWNTMGEPSRALDYARQALALAEGVEDDILLMRVLTVLSEAEFRLGVVSAPDAMSRAMALEEKHPGAVSGFDSPTRSYALQLWRMEQLDTAKALIDRIDEAAEAAGDHASRVGYLLTYGTIDISRGEVRRALRWLDAASELAKQTGQDADDGCIMTFQAMAHAYAGQTDRARSVGIAALHLAEETDFFRFVVHSRSVLGLAALFDGDLESARSQLEAAHAGLLKIAIAEPNLFHTLVPDYAEVLTVLGDLDRAIEVIAPYEEAGRRLGRTCAVGNALRCRGMVAAAAGDIQEADRLLSEAVARLEMSPFKHDYARALRALGAHYRRTKRKRLAREALTRSAELFTSVGADGWAESARLELARIGGRSPGPIDLTETESKVAQMVAAGLTNKEVAERMFISVRTVETNLSKVYRKLGIRSRTELANRMVSR